VIDSVFQLTASHLARKPALLVAVLLLDGLSFAGPEFSRQYNTSCSTCHTFYPQLNNLGKAFRDAGFQFPENDAAFIEIPRTYLHLSPFAATQDAQSRLLADAMPPDRVPEPELQKYLHKLEILSTQLNSHTFPYRFCLSTALAAPADVPCTSQHAVRIARLGDETVLEITGNYYAAYSRRRVNPSERVRLSFQQVILPILNIAVAQFKNDPRIQRYTIEVSHYVLVRVLGVSWEAPENLAVVIPRGAAEKLVEAHDPGERQVAIQAGQVFLNAKPLAFVFDQNSEPK